MTASEQVTAPKGRIQSLQALRGIAAGIVVVAHAIEHAPGKSIDPITLTGRFGVDIFFVISGFVILYVAGNAPFRPLVFLGRRIWRIVPLYWALTLIVAAAALFSPGLFKTTQFGTEYLFKSLLFIPDALPGTQDWRPIFKLGWTLNYEMFFYIAVGLLFWCRSMIQRALLLTAIMGGLVTLSFFVTEASSILAFYANLNMLPFIVGVWLAVAWRQGLIQAQPRIVALIVLLLALIVTVFFFQIPFWTTKRLGGHMLMSVAAALVGLAALLYEHRLARFRASEWLGDISYSLYLVHMFVVGVGWAVLNRLDIVPGSPLAIAGIIVMIAASLVIASVVYYLFERPLMRLMDRRKHKGTSQDNKPIPA